MAEFKSQDEKTKQAFSMIEQGVKDVYSSESFKQYLSCLSKFHSYSLNNTLLILSQKPEASLVAGYRAWQTNFNRHVNKGEKGLMILAPVTTKEDRLMNKHDENGNVILDESGNPVQEMRVVNLTHFKTTTVFDISQTSGDPLPSLVHDLTGSSNEVKAIIQTIQSVCTISIEFKTETEDLSFMTGAKGYYSPRKDKIVKRPECMLTERSGRNVRRIHRSSFCIHAARWKISEDRDAGNGCQASGINRRLRYRKYDELRI